MANALVSKMLGWVGIQDQEDIYEEEVYDEMAQEEEMEEIAQPRTSKKGKIINMPASNPSSKMRMIVYQPNNNEDTQDIIDNLKDRKAIIVNLDELETDVAQRVLDFISGAVYALNGSIKKVARSIFVVAPSNIDVDSNEMEEEVI